MALFKNWFTHKTNFFLQQATHLLWCIWSERNKFIWQGVHTQPRAIVRWAAALFTQMKSGYEAAMNSCQRAQVGDDVLRSDHSQVVACNTFRSFNNGVIQQQMNISLNMATNHNHVAITPNGWEPPHLPFMKCNCDAALFLDGSSVCYSLIVQNFAGDFICAKAGLLPDHISILKGEALSVHEALSWLKSIVFTHVVVEVDNKILFESLASQENGFSYLHL